MNEFLKKIVVLTEELIKADGFHSLIIINDMELEYAKHIKEILGHRRDINNAAFLEEKKMNPEEIAKNYESL